MKNRKYFIQKIKYDDKVKTLEVYWSIDKVWQHFNVPKAVYLEFLSAQNKEEYYNLNFSIFKHRQKWRSAEELLKICSDILLIGNFNNGVNSKNPSNEMPIHLAAFWGDVDAIKQLVSMGSEIDTPGDCDCTPLFDAVSFGNIDAAKLLLELGASPFSQNDLDYTPYEKALEDGDTKMIEVFLPYINSA
jgi:ankyrin repeat protein